MIFGSNKFTRHLLLCLVLAPGVSAAEQSSHGYEKLAHLLAELSRVESSTVSFSEEKILSTHKNPIRLKGTLSYRKPDYVQKKIDEPYAETLEVSGDVLRLTDYEGFIRQVSLQEKPEVHLYVDAIRGFLSGDFALLEKNFTINYQGSAVGWKVSFVPLSRAEGLKLKQIAFEGQQINIRKIVVSNQEDESILNLYAN